MDSQDSEHFCETEDQQIKNRKLARREGFEKLMRVQDQVLQEHGGELFTDSIKLLYESREERDRELGIADEGCDRLEARPDKLKEISERLYRENNYQFFEDSVEVIREMREERLRELMGEE